MKNILEGLEPQSVLNYFEQISQIPRGSGNEKAISDYLCNFAKELNLEYIQDEHLNVIIKKKATKGYENCPGVILQGHMDMVCEKNKSSNHDFLNDPIQLRVEGDMIYATDTTLGADDGIAVAYAMAILASDDIKHPALEVLITTDEEVGMTGAINLDASNLNGKYMINIDSEEEGFILVGCAGGNRNCISLPLEFTDSDKQGILIELKGLVGGHSGSEIDKNHANSNKLMGRILNLLDVDYDLVSINGGLKQNAIPRECDAVVAVDKKDLDEFKAQIGDIQKIFNHEYQVSDPDIKIEIGEAYFDKVLTDNCKDKIIKILNLIPNGVQTMCADIPGLVESSTNIGVVTTKENAMLFENATRSSVGTRREDINHKIKLLADCVGADYEQTDPYPEWERAMDSKLEKISLETYKNLTGKEAQIITIHAGLECGLFLQKMKGCEAISIGPNTYDAHTPNEHISISSIQNVWDYLIALLENMNQY
ncbi:MAG: aminoacyl-histidine dipeptidase [Intestinibacter sp.]|uniref:aminoacyl-histidine dipeptidase n=1 Tax=Intestinibacter sp. TaxID=1965304 RepID=UPI0025BA311F|nr:aminoacyl-histidine dipeptidase [Intestinibacter sp.]MCI6736573.1 aminoacyl-histidine dipeptidase [Intestinibacter sp.]